MKVGFLQDVEWWRMLTGTHNLHLPRPIRVVVCLGDELTLGFPGASYLSMLQARFSGDGVRVVNAGRLGERATDLPGRLDQIVTLQPTAVVVLVGTHDIRTTLDNDSGMAITTDERRDETSLRAAFRRSLDSTIDRLQTSTKASIAVVEIPSRAEDPGGAHNRLVGLYNEDIRIIAHVRNVSCLAADQLVVEPISGRTLLERSTTELRTEPPPGSGTDREGAALPGWTSTSIAGVKLSARGCRLIADRVEAFIRCTL